MTAPDPTAAEVHALFERVFDLSEAERAAVLDEACAGRPKLRACVEELLAVDAAGHTLLDPDPARFWAVLLDDDTVSREIGPYRIVRELGRGGMGVVYLAERSDPELRQLVALKLIGPRPDAESLAARFRRERQILADLHHPNIAQLHDGGLTPEGLPFFAMEYVEGEPIDAWCDVRRLSIAERLRLFLTVCDAVRHAQQNLVVHRDLKPANILVTRDGVVKLLDFGIAKLLPDEPATSPDATQTASHAFTPRYAAPEQIRGGGVSTATDVYALGVVLYELLTGVRPFPETADPFEAARMVLEHEPEPPSRAAARSAEAATARATTQDRLRRRLKGDLNAIVLKALRKAPGERYPSAAALMDDIVRHLRHEPVAARPDGARYRLRKFVRRRRGAVAAVAALVALSTGFVAVHTTRIARERDRAELAASKAEEARDFLVGLFNANLPQQSLGEEVTVGEILEQGVARADSLLDRPELRSLMLTTIGDVYRVLGRYDEARPLIDASVAGYRDLGTDSLGLADALVSRAMLAYDLEEFDAALAPNREALGIKRRILGEDHPEVLRLLSNQATLASRVGDAAEALRAHEELLERRRRVLGTDAEDVAMTLNNIASIHYRQERLDEAERYFREALELRRRILPREHPDIALSLNNLAAVLRERGDLDGAEPLLREALEIRREVLPSHHPSVAVSHYNLARLHQLRGQLDSAETHLRATLDIDRRAYGPDHPEVAFDALQLARLLVRRGDCNAAWPVFDEAIRVYEGTGRGEEAEKARGEREACGGG